MAGNWDIIVPAQTVNLVTNPSFETNTTGWGTSGTNTIAASTTQSKFGYRSLLCTYQDDLNMGYTNITLTAAAHTASWWIYVPTTFDGTAINLAAEGFTSATGTLIVAADLTKRDQWQRVEITFTPDGGDLTGSIVARAVGPPTAGRFVYIDAVQCEALSYSTTFCDGDQPGCEWNGTKHASTSTRSAQSRAGGRVYDLDTQYGLKLGQLIGIGAAPQSPDYEESSDQPGGSVSGVKTHGRVFTLAGVMFSTTSFANLHAQRQALYSVLDPEAVPHTDKGPQPVILRYRGAAVTKEIACHYEGGFEGTFNAALKSFERIALRFLAPDPFWYQIGQTSAVLDSSDSATFRNIAGRLRSAGQWSILGMAANPTAGTGAITDIARGPDGKWYIAGDFETWNNINGADYLVRYDPVAATFELVGSANDFNDVVYALAWGSDNDTLYIGGAFTDAGDGDGDGLATYSISGDAISSLAAKGAATITYVNCLAVGTDGTLYIGGNFTDLGDGDGDYVASWTSAGGYASMADGLNSIVHDFAIGPDGTLWIVGQFTQDGAAAALSRIATWDGSSFGQINGDTGLSTTTRSVIVDTDGLVYVGGDFLNAGGDANADYIAAWTGGSFVPLGTTPPSAAVLDLVLAPDGILLACGSFTSIGGVTMRAARWNRSSWTPLDLTPGAATYEFGVGPLDPVNGTYDLFLGHASQAALSYGGTTTVTNNGTAPIYPQFVVNRSGGTSARLISLRNETTGKLLSFDYSLLDGETLTVDMDPQAQTVTSDFFGSRFAAYLVGGDLGTWALQSGSNQVTCFVDVAGATVTAYLLWRDAYKAAD